MARCCRFDQEASAVFSIKQVADRFSPSLVGFRLRLALFGAHVVGGFGIHGFRGAALRAAVGETGLIRSELELFAASHAGFDRKRHFYPW